MKLIHHFRKEYLPDIRREGLCVNMPHVSTPDFDIWKCDKDVKKGKINNFDWVVSLYKCNPLYFICENNAEKVFPIMTFTMMRPYVLCEVEDWQLYPDMPMLREETHYLHLEDPTTFYFDGEGTFTWKDVEESISLRMSLISRSGTCCVKRNIPPDKLVYFQLPEKSRFDCCPYLQNT